MDRQTVVAEDLVARYLRGELDEATRNEFEAFYLTDEQTLDELELLGAAWRAEHAGSAATPVELRPPAQPRGRPALAMAASLGIGLVTGALLFSSEPPPTDAVAMAGSAVLLEIGATRSAGAMPSAVLPVDAAVAVLPVAIGRTEGRYDLELTCNEVPVTQLVGLSPDAFGELTIAVPAASLSAGACQMTVRSEGANPQVIVTHRFELRDAAGS